MIQIQLNFMGTFQKLVQQRRKYSNGKSLGLFSLKHLKREVFILCFMPEEKWAMTI